MICLLVASLRFALVVIWMKSIPCLAGNIFDTHCCAHLYMKELFRTSIVNCSVADPDLQIRWGRSGGAVSKKIFFRPFAPQFGGLKVRERRGPRPSPLDPPLLSYFVCEHYCLVFRKKKTKEKEDVKPFNIDFIGRLVGGHETLNAMERVECDEKDRPKVNAYRIQFNSCLFR